MKKHEIIEAGLRKLGSSKSGNYGHAGRPGKRGGSVARGGAAGGAGVVKGVQLPQTGAVLQGGKVITERYPDTSMSGEMKAKWGEQSAEQRIEDVLNHTYAARTKQVELGPLVAKLQHIEDGKDYPTRDALNVKWKELLSSSVAQKPAPKAAEIMKAYGYAG